MKFITIGGGQLALSETLKIDRFIVEATGKASPRALFIPTASGDAEGYCETFRKVYQKTLGCKADMLLATSKVTDEEALHEKIAEADLLYVGGGNTRRLLEIWKNSGIDQAILRAAQEGTVISGLSAGAICWYQAGLSDAQRFDDTTHWHYTNITALGWLPGMFCPHLDYEKRHGPLIESVMASGNTAIACDNGAALYWDSGRATVLTSMPGAHAYLFSGCGQELTIRKFSDGDVIPSIEFINTTPVPDSH